MEQDDDMNSFVTKSHLFGAQRALHEEQQAMSECIDNLATDLRLSEQRTKEYFDHKLDDHKQENDTRMDEISALLLNSSSSTSRRSRSSRHSDFTLYGSSTPTSNTLRRAARADRQASLNPLRDTDSQERRQCQTQEAFALAREQQCQRQHEEEERARLHQNAQDAEAQRQAQQLHDAQALAAQQALRDSSRAIADRSRQAREQEEAHREEIQEQRFHARVHRQIPLRAREDPPQARQHHQVHREHEDNGNPPRQEQHEYNNPPRQEHHELNNHLQYGCHHPRPQHNEEQCYGKLKFTMPKFNGSNDPEEYLSWAFKVDKIFRLHNYDKEKKIAMASLKFQDYVLIWWEQVIERREARGEPPITTWAQMKDVMRARFVPTYYNRDLFKKLQ